MASNSNTLQNGPATQLQPITAPKQRRSTKGPAIKNAVLAKYVAGETKTQIAKDLQIAHNTVSNILSLSEIEETVQRGRSRAVSLIPRSLDVAEYRLSKNDGSMALGILRGTQVLQNQQVIGTQLNMQANTWITMRQQKQAEDAQIIEAECVKPAENTPTNSIPTPPPSKS